MKQKPYRVISHLVTAQDLEDTLNRYSVNCWEIYRIEPPGYVRPDWTVIAKHKPFVCGNTSDYDCEPLTQPVLDVLYGEEAAND